MLCKAIDSYYRIKRACNGADEDEIMFYLNYDEDYSLIIYNEGRKTFKDWKKDPNRIFYYKKLKELPIAQTYLNKKGQLILLSHAGYTPYIESLPSEEDLIWNRSHFNQKWNNAFPDSIIIHGHTPIPYFNEYLYDYPKEVKLGAFWYCNNHKVNIDCGTVLTGISTMIDLDTWEEHIIIDKKEWAS